MQKSLMPKGVDHDHPKAAVALGLPKVQKSLMPKGVDHSEKRGSSASSVTVQKSLMPKGVDHRPGPQ